MAAYLLPMPCTKKINETLAGMPNYLVKVRSGRSCGYDGKDVNRIDLLLHRKCHDIQFVQ